jgi:hypothetical protein
VEGLRSRSYGELNRMIEFLEAGREGPGLAGAGGSGGGAASGGPKYVVPVKGGRIGEALARLREMREQGKKK